VGSGCGVSMVILGDYTWSVAPRGGGGEGARCVMLDGGVGGVSCFKCGGGVLWGLWGTGDVRRLQLRGGGIECAEYELLVIRRGQYHALGVALRMRSCRVCGGVVWLFCSMCGLSRAIVNGFIVCKLGFGVFDAAACHEGVFNQGMWSGFWGAGIGSWVLLCKWCRTDRLLTKWEGETLYKKAVQRIDVLAVWL